MAGALTHMPSNPSIAVAIPCYNEATTIAKVVADFRAALPAARIYVYDNNSTDATAAVAKETGAEVHRVAKQGKGNVLRAIFDDLKEDVVVLVDGDDTYPAAEVHKLLEPVLAGEADMAVGERLAGASLDNMKPLNHAGNRIFVWGINWLFRAQYVDVLSGYRVFNRRFIENVPVLTSGFEVETEITIHALGEGLRVVEVPVSYRARPEDSHSKLRPFADGYRIALTTAILLRDHHPLRLFGWIAIGFWLVALVAGVLRILSFTGRATLPESILGGLVLVCVPTGMIALGIGLSLNAINTRFQEIKNFLRRNQ